MYNSNKKFIQTKKTSNEMYVFFMESRKDHEQWMK